ncbi:MAG: hypothetical protein IKQ77_17100 [Prevotella sp.]|nr:hypothetical protein [Prevotella sp.]
MAAFTALAVLTSCGDSENEYTTKTCYFIFDNSVHNDATLASAMNPSAPGIFCQVTMAMRSGATYYDFANNAGTSSSSIQNAVDTKRTLILGYNNGIIVGYGALDIPASFYAYDRECPNCFNPNDIPMRSAPLAMTSNGIATCAKCHRKYDMNNNGFITDGEKGKRLTRYRATTTGPFGVLVVN